MAKTAFSDAPLNVVISQNQVKQTFVKFFFGDMLTKTVSKISVSVLWIFLSVPADTTHHVYEPSIISSLINYNCCSYVEYVSQ